ncbi:hypothetical protein [Paenibacillus sp. LPE1-1-1.1]|uniref:hypothetical protein n=1 Tax=Paenibacillus sp. LPE1-1-1.1 TaxID=3135230 RepID=UPI0034267C47
MVTFAFFMILFIMVAVITGIDMASSKSDIIQSLQGLLAERAMIFIACGIGLVFSVVNDIRLSKNKLNSPEK